MARFEEDGLNECDFCGNLWITCTCTEEDFNNTCLDSKSDIKPVNRSEITVTSESIPKIIDGAEVTYITTKTYVKE